jgi:hypothetical protein
MASQVVADMLTGAPGEHVIVDSAEQSILGSWGKTDPGALIAQARQAAKQRLQALQAERTA